MRVLATRPLGALAPVRRRTGRLQRPTAALLVRDPTGAAAAAAAAASTEATLYTATALAAAASLAA